MKKLFIMAMACYALNANAQVDRSRNFVYLYSDSVIYAQKIRLRPDMYGSWQIRADSKRIPTDQVKFMSNEDGFFANTRKFNLTRTNTFSERVIEGRINLFQEASYDPYAFDRGYRYRHNRPQAVDTRMFYNKGWNDLQKVNYHNLSRDMADHPESMDLLKGYRKSMNTAKGMYVGAGVALIAGLITFMADGKSEKMPDFGGFGSDFGSKKSSFATSFILLGVGAVLGGGGAVIQMSSTRRLENAIESYNK
jgi:hypothetical protein